MTTINLTNVRNELTYFLRNSDILTTAIRGATTATDTFVATAGQIVFNLTHTGIRNIRSLTVQAVSKAWIRDYTFNAITGVVTLNVGATLGDSVIINYDYGTSGEKIYPDRPRDDITLTSFPRIGIDIPTTTTTEFGLGGATHITDPLLVTIFIWVPVNKDSAVAGGIGGTTDLNDLISTIRDKIRIAAKNFITFPWITPASTTGIIAGQNNKIIQMSQDFKVRFVTE
jgi:hypothetical protein